LPCTSTAHTCGLCIAGGKYVGSTFGDSNEQCFSVAELSMPTNKISNKELKTKLRNFKNSGLAADGELSLQKTILQQYMIQNIILLIIIIFFFYKLYNKENILL
jgi:hypothetical protein